MCGYRVFEMWLVRLRKWTLNFVLFANLILNLSGHTWLTAAVLHKVQLWAWCWPACDAPRGLSRLLLPWMGSSGNVIKPTWDHCFPCHCPVTQLCLTLCDPMDCNTPGFPVLHHLLELAQIHVHWVGDAIQPSHPLSTPSPPALNLSQHQDLFQGVGLSVGRYKKAAEPKSWCSEKSHDGQSCLHPKLFCFLLLLTSRGMVPTHHTSPDRHRRYPYPERNGLMPSVLGKILCTCIIPLLRRYILIIDNKEIQKNDKEKNQINYITFWCISLWYALKSFCCYCWFADV